MERLLCRLALDAASLDASSADWLLPELQAVVGQEMREREAIEQLEGAPVLTLGHSLRAGGANGGAAGDLAALSRATGGFRMLEDDQLTCVECHRVLYLSGVTRVFSDEGGGGGGGIGGARSPPPCSACLVHAKILKPVEGYKLVRWHRHEEGFLRALAPRVAARIA